MDIIQANLIENMVDDSIGKHYKIIGLEKTCDSIKQALTSGEKRMDRMHGDIKDIKDSQFAMSGNVIAITKSINGNVWVYSTRRRLHSKLRNSIHINGHSS